MELFIQIKNGLPFQHPILGDNFRQVFPDIDVNNLPPEFARFERIPQPLIGIYQIYDGVTYEWIDGIVKDVHHIRDMTIEEKTAKQDSVKTDWVQNSGYASWIFDEELCSFVPPIPYPTDGNNYTWDEQSISWTIS